MHQRVPKRGERFEDRNIGMMLNTFRTQRDHMAPERRAALDTAMPGWAAVNEAQVAAIAAALSEAEKVALFKRFYAAHKRVPKYAERFEGKKIGSMLSGFRSQRERMAPERRQALDAAMPGWDAVNEARVAGIAAALSEAEKVALFARFYVAHQRVPKRGERFEDRNIGMMLNTFRTQRDHMVPECRQTLDAAMPGWAVMNDEILAKQEAEKVALFARFYVAHQRVPKRGERFEGKKIGSMLNTFRNQRERMAPERRQALDAAMPGWAVMNDEILAKQEAVKMALFTRFYAVHQRVPKSGDVFEEQKIGTMLNMFRSQRDRMAPERRLALDAAMPGWAAVNEALVAGRNAMLSEAEKVALFARFYAAHQRVPKRDERFEDQKIGSILHRFRTQRDRMAPERRAALDAAMPGWAAVNEARVAAAKLKRVL